MIDTYQCSTSVQCEANLQKYLAGLANLRIAPDKRTWLGLRYANTFEVQCVLSKLNGDSAFISDCELFDNLQLNVAITVLKEVLVELYGGIFVQSRIRSEYIRLFSELELDTPLDSALRIVKRFIKELSSNIRHLAYSICRSLRNLAEQSAGPLLDSYTDLLLLFTPVLFPESVKEIRYFLQATRISLMLVDFCQIIFKPLCDDIPLCDSAYFSDGEFIPDDWENIASCFNSIETLSEETKGSDLTSDGSSNYADEIETCTLDEFADTDEMFMEDSVDCCFEFEHSFSTVSRLNNQPGNSNYYMFAFTDVE